MSPDVTGKAGRYFPSLGLIAAVFAFSILFPAWLRASERVKVVEIVDGDTVRVRTGGETRSVRLIGIDAPERSHPSRPKEFQADEAADYLASLCGGKTVLMESGDEDEDRYGRLLRYLFLPPPDGRLVNLEMVRSGYARAYRRFRFAREAEFSEAEAEARKGERGIWREGGMAEARWAREHGTPAVEVIPLGGDMLAVSCGGMIKSGIGREELGRTVQEILRLRAENSDEDFARAAKEAGFLPVVAETPRALPGGPYKTGGPSASSASHPAAPLPPGVVSWDEAHRHVDEEIVVQGTLVRVHRAKKVLYLNFHSNWKKYITLVVLEKDLRRFPKDPEAFYKGKTVRARGKVILYKDRPEIVIRSPKSITILK